MITLGRALVLIEAKYKSGVSIKTTYDDMRDQVIRLIDVGSWYARLNGLDDTHVIVLNYGDSKTNAQEIVSKYKRKPEAIQGALYYRADLTDSDFMRLSQSVSFVRWVDPWSSQPEDQ